MGKRFIAATTLASFLMATGLPALALTPASRGNVESVAGQVLARSGSEAWANLGAGALDAGSAVRTGPDGQAIIAVGQSRLRLAPNTEIRLLESSASGSQLVLERGRILGKTGDKMVIKTSKTQTTASKGDFVLETTIAGSQLKVLDGGNATLVALSGTDVALPGLAQLPAPVATSSLALGSLAHLQISNEPELLAEGPTKGKGVRVRDTKENVGADEDALPDQDVPTVQEQPPAVEAPPQAPAAPPIAPAVPPATTTVPTTTTTTVAAGGGGLGAAGIVGLVALLGGGIALAVSNDSDNDNDFVPGNPGVPSPSLP